MTSYLKIQGFFIQATLILIWLLYILSFIGLYSNAPKYLNTLKFIFHLYISIFLIVRFGPFFNNTVSSLDRRVAFISGMMFLSSIILGFLFR